MAEPEVTPDDMREIAGRVREALESADLVAFRDLLDPDVTWGAPDGTPVCRNRDQVLSWYQRGRDDGVRARVTEMTVEGERIVVGLVVIGTPEQVPPGGEKPRWVVLTLVGGRVADIRGFDDRDEAVSRAAT